MKNIKAKSILSVKKYKKIVKIINKYNFNKFELINNYGLFCGDNNLFKTLTVYEIIQKIKNIKGDIIEFGVWKGNNGLLIKKILDIYNIKKKLYLFDHFKGLIHFEHIDKKALIYKNQFIGNKKMLTEIIKFYKFKDISIIFQDATKLTKNSFNKKKFALVYIDVDLYEPTKKILMSIVNKVEKGGLIIFDEGNDSIFAGESKAMKEFLNMYKKFFEKEKIPFARQPDIILRRKNNSFT